MAVNLYESNAITNYTRAVSTCLVSTTGDTLLYYASSHLSEGQLNTKEKYHNEIITQIANDFFCIK